MRLLVDFYYAADCLRAEPQCGWPANDFDLVAGERIDRHKMVFAEVGGAIGADAVLLDADAIDVEPADDRPAGCTGRKARSGDAGLFEQEVAERAAAVSPQLLVRHDRDGGELVGDDRDRSLTRVSGAGAG